MAQLLVLALQTAAQQLAQQLVRALIVQSASQEPLLRLVQVPSRVLALIG
jgi:hypothetical protein